jgi:hypothetical protein
MVGVGCPSVSAPFTVGPGLRMLFDWLVVGQVVPTNPTAVVRGPKHVVKTGKTPVLEGSEWRKLLKSIPTTTLRDLRDPGPHRHADLQLRAHHCGAKDEGRGFAAAWRPHRWNKLDRTVDTA